MTTVTGPTSSTVGNIAFFDNTSGSSIGAAPAYQSGNPGHAAIFSQVANPASGYTTIYNGLQFSQGTPIPAAQQFGANSVSFGIQQAIVGTASIPAADATTGQAAGVAGYAITNTATGGAGAVAVGVFGQGSTGIANASVFGSNFVAQNVDGNASVQGFNCNYIAGLELDVNLWKLPGGADPTVNGGHAYGLVVAGSSNLAATVPNSSAVVVDRLSVFTNIPWNFGFSTYAGAAINAFVAGPMGVGSNQPSQLMVYQSVDAGGVPRAAVTFSDQNGSYYIAPSANAAVIIEDGNGNVLIETLAGLGGSHVRLPALTSAGVVTNDASGVLSSSTTLPSGLTLSGTTAIQGSIVPSLSAGTPIIDSSGTTISLGAGANGLIANNIACEIAIREASFTGELAKVLLGPYGIGTMVAQSGPGWSLGTSPPSTGFSIGFDSGSNTWKLYNGSGAARTFSFALTRFG